MTVTIEARLLSGASPQRVQVTVAGLVSGDVYEVRCTWDGGSYQVAGGEGVSDGDQVVLVDPWAPLRLPVVYTASVGGQVVASSEALTVPSATAAVLTSLDGWATVPVTGLWNGMPRTQVIRSVAYDVPGRSRPPGRYTQAGDGGGTLSLATMPEDRVALEALIRSGEPLVLRTSGTANDLDAVVMLVTTSIESALPGPRPAIRVWQVDYLLTDNPDPSVVLIAFTWSQFDQVYAGSTWNDFDQEWQGRTWNDFDTEDWGSRLA